MTSDFGGRGFSREVGAYEKTGFTGCGKMSCFVILSGAKNLSSI
jgi:hypothetical protein